MQRIEVLAQPGKEISDQWVRDFLVQFVKLGNVVGYENHVPPYREVPFQAGEFDPNSLQTNIVSFGNRLADTPDEVLSVLLNGNFRKGSMESVLKHKDVFLKRITAKMRRADPVKIVFPALPFKDQNPLTTRRELRDVDLGEYGMMAQLRDIVESVREVYPPGLRITILTDGIVYADIFANGELDEIEKYRQNCIQAAEAMGLGKRVEFVDLSRLTEAEPEFPSVKEMIRERIVDLEKRNAEVQERMKSLRWGMLVNVPSLGYSYNDFKLFLALDERDLPENIFERISQSALDYASFSSAMSALELIDRNFPGAIRGTVHPKGAPHLPLHLVNRDSVVFPYNGVPVVSEERLRNTSSIRRSLRIMRFCDVLQHPDARGIVIDGQDNPFYYLVGRHKRIE